MNRVLILLVLFLAFPVSMALSERISEIPVDDQLLGTDHIPTGRVGRSVARTTTPDQILQGYHNYSAAGRVTSFNGRTGAVLPNAIDYVDKYPTRGSNWTFNAISTASISISQGDQAQIMELAVSASAGNNTVTFAPYDNISTSQHIRVGTHGLFVNGVQVLSW